MEIDSNYLNGVKTQLANTNLSPKEQTSVLTWLTDNALPLYNLTKPEIKQLLEAIQGGETTRLQYYDALVAEMDWNERIQLMKNSIAALRESASPNLNLAAVLVSASELAVKLIPIIMMFL